MKTEQEVKDVAEDGLIGLLDDLQSCWRTLFQVFTKADHLTDRYKKFELPDDLKQRGAEIENNLFNLNIEIDRFINSGSKNKTIEESK